MFSGLLAASTAITAHAAPIQTVFVIAMENHNWAQPSGSGGPAQILGNPDAPFINSLVNGTASAVVNGSTVNISSQTAYASAYHNVLATPSGANPDIHPSEPNYIWAEAGSNLHILNDNDPYSHGGTALQPTNLVPTANNQSTINHLSSYLTRSGQAWKSYQEDADLTVTGGQLNNTPRAPGQFTVPSTSFSGNFASGTNAFNGSTQYNYAVKHNPQALFNDTNGGTNATTSNPLAQNYAPLQQLQTDLANNTVGKYNWITPNQFNDMHTGLSSGFTIPGTSTHLTGDNAAIAQGDNFLAQIVPQIMGSQAYKNNGAIILWWDETEGSSADSFNTTIPEIVISPDAAPNVGGLPFASNVDLTHSSDLLSMKEIFDVGPCLGDACNATDLSSLFAAGSIPQGINTDFFVPEPASWLLVGSGVVGLGLLRRRKQRLVGCAG